MTRRLVIVTQNYPFRDRGGEVMFVAPELQRLARDLGPTTRLIVAPLRASGDRLPTPGDVHVDTTLAEAMRRGRLTSYLRALAWPGFFVEAWRGWRRGGAVGVTRVWRWAAQAATTHRWAGRDVRAPHDATLYYTFWRGGSTLALARGAARPAAAAVVTRVHRYELYEDAFDPPFQPWHPAMYEHLALTAAISQHGFDYLRRAGVTPERLQLFRLGTEAPSTLARASQDGVLRIVSCSHVTAVKRVPLIADALIAFARAHPQRAVAWTHFGDGPDLPAVRERLRAAPANLTAVLTGAVENARVIDHYAREPVDLFLLLSASEGLPVSIQEAAAAAIPVIATDVGGVREIVGSDNGALLPADPTLAAVVGALESLLLDPDAPRRAARRAASRRRWAEGFDAETNHARFARRLGDLLDTLNDPTARSA
jgi:glycosyltransferase involved in cell wall biosynthesis